MSAGVMVASRGRVPAQGEEPPTGRSFTRRRRAAVASSRHRRLVAATPRTRAAKEHERARGRRRALRAAGTAPAPRRKGGKRSPDCPDIARAGMPEDRLDGWRWHRGGSPS